MKKSILYTIVFLAFSLQIFASGTQMTGWVWRNDDGDENTATYMTEENFTPVTISDPTKNIRLRIRIDKDYGGETFSNSLFYALDTMNDGTNSTYNFVEIGPYASFDWAPSNYTNDGAPLSSLRITLNSDTSTNQLKFQPGEFTASSRMYACPPYAYFELEYCIRPTENIIPGKYLFKPGGDVYLYNDTKKYNSGLAALTYQGPIIPEWKKEKAISTDSLKTVVGSIFTLPVKSAKVVALDSIISYQFDLSYDPTMIEYYDYSLVETLSQNSIVQINSEESGKLKIACAYKNKLLGAGSLVNLKFKALHTGKTTPVISNFLYNTDSVKKISNLPIDIQSIMLGDLDKNLTIQSYDAAIALQHSVGLTPKFWYDWSILAADVDGDGVATAYDAGLILQKAIGIISTFPVNNPLKNATIDNASISIVQDGENLLFKAHENLIGLNITARNNQYALGIPAFSKDALFATNISDNVYSLGQATSSAPIDGTTILTIPIKTNTIQNLSFDVTVNNIKSVANVNIVTAITDTKNGFATVYPNPATDFIQIDNITDGATLSIYDLTGRKLAEKVAVTNSESMAVGNLSAGFYNLVITNGKDKTVTKIIKK